MPDIDATNTEPTTPEESTMPVIVSTIPATALIPARGDDSARRTLPVAASLQVHDDSTIVAIPSVGMYVPVPGVGDRFTCSDGNCTDSPNDDCRAARVALAGYVVGPVVTASAMDAALAVLRQQPIPVGTLVQFHPPRGMNGTEYAHGVIVETRPHTEGGSHADYRIATLLPCGDTIRSTRSNGGTFGEWVGPIATDSVWTEAARVVGEETPTSVAVGPVTVLPRTATEAIERADALDMLACYVPGAGEIATELRGIARWLDGGELMSTGHAHAAEADLCGEYESLVCPVLGWTPRRGQASSKARLMSAFDATMAEHEASHATLPPAAVIRAWVDRYARGGVVNMAVIQHVDDHLETHKIPGVNDLLSDVLNWQTVPVTRDYVITVDVSVSVDVVTTRTIDGEEVDSDSESMTATQTVTIHRSGCSEDDASDGIDSYDVAGAIDPDDWYVADLNASYAMVPSRSALDWDVVDVSED